MKNKMLRRVIFFAIVALILGGAGFGIFKLFFASGKPVFAEIIALNANSDAKVLAVDDHFLVVNGVMLSYMDAKGNTRWQVTLPETDMLPAGSNMISAAYGGNRVVIYDQDGRGVLDQTVSGIVAHMSCGQGLYALTLWEDDQRLVRVNNLEGVEQDVLRFPYEAVLDTGFYGNNLGQFWTLSLDSHYTQPVARLKTYNPGQSSTGNMSANNELFYHMQYVEADKQFVTVGTHYLQRWSSSGDVLFSKLVYGWSLVDMNVDKQGKVQMLLAPSNTADENAPLSSLWYIRMNNETDITEYRLNLPADTLGACLGDEQIVTFTASAVHTTTFAGERYRMTPLPSPVTAVAAVLPGKAAVLVTVDGLQLLPLT